MNGKVGMMKALLYNPIGMFDKDLVEVYWSERQNHDLRVGFLNLLLST